jgi:hypothetical protein
MDQASTASMSADRMDSLPSAGAEVLAERHLVRRVMIWMAIFVPARAAFFALFAFVAVRTSGVPAGAPVAMEAGSGVLAGVLFGMWAGAVARVEEIEHSNLVLTRPSNS